MKHVSHIIAALLAAAATATAAQAQYVKGNEAVTEGAMGKSVERPPIPSTSRAARGTPCAPNAGCHAGAWSMVETSEGLQECTEPFAREGSCRPSTFGAKKLTRVWVIKKQGKWLQCQHADLKSKCVDMYAKPPNNLPTPSFE